MKGKNEYPKKKNLDGMFFRLERNGKFEDVCITDMTDDEFYRIAEKNGKERMTMIADGLRRALIDIANQFGIEGYYGTDDD